jgi:GGDEF domain-containing protein
MTSYFLCTNIRHGLDWMLSYSSSDHIQSIKDKYKHLRGDISMKVFHDLQVAIKTNASLKIKLDISKWDVNYIDAQFRDQDLSKIHEYKKFMNDGDVTASKTIEEYNGKPSAIVWHKRKRYK